MKTATCQHKEKIDSTPSLPGREIGTCSECGQVRQYDLTHPKQEPTVTKLGRLNGQIVIPSPKFRLILDSEDSADLKAAIAITDALPDIPPKPDTAGMNRKEMVTAMNAYYEANKERIIADFHRLGNTPCRKHWGISASTWTNLKRRWGLPLSEKHILMRKGKGTKSAAKEAGIPPMPPEYLPNPKPETNKTLPPFPVFNEGWPADVKVEWFRAYKELSLA